MEMNVFQDLELSRLGFGAMRLPVLEDGKVDEAQVFEMVRYAAEHGVNYFDTAYPYHGGQSELVIGRALKQLPRESFYLATKYPGHQIAPTYNPAEIFEEQLVKCDVDYFDFYLLHNINESSVAIYNDPKWGIVDYFVEQKRLGRIKHLGFSAHALLPTLEEFLDRYGDIMEFCQIQLNYLDWTLQNAKEKYELLTKRNIPVWVMEPVRGGKLASMPEKAEKQMKAFRPEASIASWAFRFLQELPNVKMILSGMSNMEQMIDNVKTFETEGKLSEEEKAMLLEIAESLKDSVPCTGCRYCCEGCPQQLDIPKLLSLYNDLRFAPGFNIGMIVDGLSDEEKASACIGCGACTKACPQNIDVPSAMKDFTERLSKMPSWAQLCKERAEAVRKLKESIK